MPQIGPLELVIVLAIALLLLGPKRLPAAAQSLGRSINEFRRGLTDHGEDRSQNHEISEAETTEPTGSKAEPDTERDTGNRRA
jgi:sec-independent protein translocase protein TatA